MAEGHRKRVKRLEKAMEAKGLDYALATSHSDIYYYTGLGLSGDDRGFLLAGKGRLVYFASILNNEAEKLKGVEVVFIKAIDEMGKYIGGGSTGFDENDISAALYSRLRKIKARWVPSAGAIKSPREVKDSSEIGRMSKGLEINREVLRETQAIGRTEKEVAWEILRGFAKRGAVPAFETIVASGRNSSFIHYTPRGRRVGQRDMVVIDFGSKANGYCTDMTRTSCRKPGSREAGIMEDMKAMQEGIIDEVKAGIMFSELQELYEKLMARKRYRVMHSIGHGIGLEVHEGPGKGAVLRPGMVITIEPGVYIKGFGGCRIEDMVLVRKNKSRVL
ncbi:MAG: aminopeptidase P family protein [Candidatus Aenigmarchaeota archaeon]|nr:aminopeptidase P family protein [Candidatus Aenigmarchaeota archaeon]